jgi:hypothetical protein
MISTFRAHGCSRPERLRRAFKDGTTHIVMSPLHEFQRPPGNMNAFKHGLAAIQKRREEGVNTEHEEGVRQQILDGSMIGLNDASGKSLDESSITPTSIFRYISPLHRKWTVGERQLWHERPASAEAGALVLLRALLQQGLVFGQFQSAQFVTYTFSIPSRHLIQKSPYR